MRQIDFTDIEQERGIKEEKFPWENNVQKYADFPENVVFFPRTLTFAMDNNSSFSIRIDFKDFRPRAKTII